MAEMSDIVNSGRGSPQDVPLAAVNADDLDAGTASLAGGLGGGDVGCGRDEQICAWHSDSVAQLLRRQL